MSDIPATGESNGSIIGFVGTMVAIATIEIKSKAHRIPVAYFITVREEINKSGNIMTMKKTANNRGP
jgi:hypothetical protein